MSPFHAIILGAVQGMAEFIPISSSAHLAILHRFFGEASRDIFFDVMLHFGTLVALLTYFWKDWYEMIRANIGRNSTGLSPESEAQAQLLWPILYACIPGALAGALMEKYADKYLDNPLVIASAMVLLGIALWLADSRMKIGRALEKVNQRDWITIGLAQVLALIPGVSRSGITITAGLFTGLRRDAAARFSFLLGTPIIFGATVFELRHLDRLQTENIVSMLLGMVAAAIVGYMCIGFLLNYLKKQSVGIFVLYRFLFAVAVFAMYGLGFIRR